MAIFMRSWFFAFVLFAACGCAPAIKSLPIRPIDLARSSVQIEIKMFGLLTSDPANPVFKGVQTGGSGVIVDRLIKPGSSHSLIVTANHVVDFPAVGETIPTKDGSFKIEMIIMKAITMQGECSFQIKALGGSNEHDVALIEADCDLGNPAQLATELPSFADGLVTTSHPLGIASIIVTGGYYSGLQDGQIVTSAPVDHGSSGGGLWRNGKLVGVITSTTQFNHITYAVPFTEINARLKELK